MELNLAEVHEAIAAAVPERECLLWRDRRLTWAEVTDRTRRLANVLGAHGLGTHRRGRLGLTEGAPWESVHDHVGLYLLNGNEYLEAMLGATKARAAAFNVNYRYVADELAHVLNDARARALVYHGRFAPTVAEVLPRVPTVDLLLRVDDGSGDDLLPGALDYEAALAAASADRPDRTWSPEDLYVLYTGGTTGLPKGVLWRQADFLVAALGLRRRDGTDFASVGEIVAAADRGGLRALPAPPFMHGAAHWNAISAWLAGAPVVIQDGAVRLDAADLLATCERHQVTSLLIVGDAFARPILDAARAGEHDLSALRFLLNGGATLSAPVKAALIEQWPELRVVDILGSSETGRQGMATTASTGAGAGALDPGSFERSATTVVLSEDRTRLLEPGEAEVGWLAQRGRVPRGYLGDPDKTRATFPEVAGERFSVAGDRARLTAEGGIELHGRDSATINTGGEKVFAEEVERALAHHPDVYDAVVVGRPHERWGSEVVAVVALRPGTGPSDEELRATAAGHLARFKLPRAFVRVDRVERSPAGKPDYRWATARAR